MNHKKLIACSVAALGTLMLTGCETTPTASMQTSSHSVSSPGHIQGYRGTGSAVEAGSRSGIFSPGHIQGYRSDISGYGSFDSPTQNWPSHINGY